MIVAVGTPLVDHIHFVTDEELYRFAKAKGGMQRLDEAGLKRLLEDPSFKSVPTSGGSAANTLKGLCHLGEACAFIGKRGDDASGREYEKKLRQMGIDTYLSSGKLPTGHAICLVTPDGERTMRTFTGAGQEMRAEDLPEEVLEKAALVHVEGYMLFCPGVCEAAMRGAGGQISLDLASFEVVEQFKEQIIDLASRYVDILFANEKEAFALTGFRPERACQALLELVPLAVVMVGIEGAFIGSRGKVTPISAIEVPPYDSTGAGDLFESGFLCGYLRGQSLEQAAHLGAKAAHEVVKILGTELSAETWKRLKTPAEGA